MGLLDVIKHERENFTKQAEERQCAGKSIGPFEVVFVFNQPFLGSLLNVCTIACFVAITAFIWKIREIEDPLTPYGNAYPSVAECLVLDACVHMVILPLLGMWVGHVFRGDKNLLLKLHSAILIYTQFRLAWLAWIPTSMGPDIFAFFLSFNTVLLWNITCAMIIFATTVICVGAIFILCVPVWVLSNIILTPFYNWGIRIWQSKHKNVSQEITHTFPEKDTSVIEENQ